MARNSFLAELRKRKVLQSAAIYGAVAWGVTEIVVTVVEQLYLPQWISTLSVIGFVVGFPVFMFLSWTFDITSRGITRTDVSSRRGKASIAVSIALLVAGTAGLFLLIKPSLEGRDTVRETLPIAANSLAVLPFQDAGPGTSDSYLSDSLADELRNQLGRVPELRIAARSSSVAALERGMDAISASATLGVAHLVEGTVRRRGNRLRVSVQLIDGRSGLAVWSDAYDRSPAELLAIQQDIADSIVEVVLPDATYVVAAPATRSADANELMLLANHYEQQVRARQEVHTETLLKAVSLYREATVADPGSALAHSRLAGALLYLGDIGGAEAPIFKALSLDPELSEVQNTLGEYYWARGLPDAGAAFRRAAELNPYNGDALHNYANFLWMTIGGKQSGLPEPEQLFRRAMEIDPLSLDRHAALGDFFGKQGRFDEVPAVIENVQTLFDSTESFRVVAWLYELIGDVDLAIAWTLKARDREPENPDHVSKLAHLYAFIGDADTALRLEPSPGLGVLYELRRHEDLIDLAGDLMIDRPDDMDVRYLLAFSYVATGQYESAIHILSSTGLPDSVLEDSARSVAEIEALMTLINALAASGLPETAELARSLATWQEDVPWWGDIGWIALNRSCNAAILGRDVAALELLPRVNESLRLRRSPELHDSWCFQKFADNPVYRDVLREQDARRARLREKLPATLEEFGVSL